MKNFSFVYDGRDDQVYLRLEEYRWRWHALAWVADAICEVSRHRFCNSLVLWAQGTAGRHVTRKLDYPMSKEQWQVWAKFAGEEDPSWHWEPVAE